MEVEDVIVSSVLCIIIMQIIVNIYNIYERQKYFNPQQRPAELILIVACCGLEMAHYDSCTHL